MNRHEKYQFENRSSALRLVRCQVNFDSRPWCGVIATTEDGVDMASGGWGVEFYNPLCLPDLRHFVTLSELYHSGTVTIFEGIPE